MATGPASGGFPVNVELPVDKSWKPEKPESFPRYFIMRVQQSSNGVGDSAVRRRIVGEARVTFFGHGFRAVTMDDLAGQMGMSKKTLYLHFRSKRELLEAVIAGKFEELEERLTGLGVGREGDFAGLLADFVACVGVSVREIAPPFVRDLAKADPALWERVRERRQAVVGMALGRILGAGRAAGAVRSDLPAELLAEILIGLMNAIAVPENLVRGGLAPYEMIGGILDVFLHGVLEPQPSVPRIP